MGIEPAGEAERSEMAKAAASGHSAVAAGVRAQALRVGVYIDAFNLYYGARARCGRGTRGWRWLDVRALVTSVVRTKCSDSSAWSDVTLEAITYCTARIAAASNPSGHADQDAYLRALTASGSVDHIELGNYVSRVKVAPVATRDARSRPVLVGPQSPLFVQDAARQPVNPGVFLVSYLHTEEKGSDVNLASHMLLDVLDGRVDAVVMVSNDSDLKYPIAQMKRRVPVGLINPGQGYTALPGAPAEGVGGHWWHSLSELEYRDHQLPDPVGKTPKPSGW